MKAIFLWFYCLPITGAVIWIILATGIFLHLRTKFGTRWFWRIGLVLMILCWTWVVANQTVLSRAPGVQQTPILEPFQSYVEVFQGGNREILRSQFMNVVLFYPAGLIIAALFPERWPLWIKVLTALVLGFMFSRNIEHYQYYLAVGLPQVDDVIHNTVGALLGSMAIRINVIETLKKWEDWTARFIAFLLSEE